MTDYNLYCDESRHTSDPGQSYAVIGALQCPREQKRRIVYRLHCLMAKHNVHGEFGWKRLSPNRRDFYLTVLQLFIEECALNFRCIVIDRRQLNHARWNAGDAELGFYKLYYQMLAHWLKPGSAYHIYLDWQQNASSSRFEDLRTILKRKLSGRARIACLEPVSSHTQPMIQLADMLMGAAGYDRNRLGQRAGGSAFKREFSSILASALGRSGLAQQTSLNEQKFNVFNWQAR